jgi:hypothetical protein
MQMAYRGIYGLVNGRSICRATRIGIPLFIRSTSTTPTSAIPAPVVTEAPIPLYKLRYVSTSASPAIAQAQPETNVLSSSVMSSSVKNIGQQKLCCRKGCLKCVDTPSYRDRTTGRAGGGGMGRRR